MAEILKITTPYVNKNNAMVATKPTPDPATNPFALQDVQTIARPATQEEILKQNNGMIDKENSANLLTGLLKDPAAAVSFLKNIMVLQELVKLLPANNTTVTQEIEQLFNSLLVKPEDISAEMMRQAQTSTTFKGDLFNFLRGLLSQNANTDTRSAVANLLKSINNLFSQQDSLNAVSNSFQYLSQTLSPSKALSQALAELSAKFRQPDAPAKFVQLKNEALALLKEVEGSLLFSPKLSKISAITVYNLSRFNDNPDFFSESATNLMLQLTGKERLEFSQIIQQFRQRFSKDAPAEEGMEQSKIMDVLTKIIGRQGDLSAINAEKIEKIIYSLLSSPCHFTPLLHFVIPVEFDFLKSFAEIWINPNGEEDRRGDDEPAKKCIHMLLAFDIEGIGQFEAEIYALDEKLELRLYCPEGYNEIFAKETARFRKCLANSPYKLEEIQVEKLERQRSLMDVFKSLPYKRTGVNVKV